MNGSSDREFSINLRIPVWAEGASILVNGKSLPEPKAGQFASVRRTWKDGDRIELTLPLKKRLEAVDAEHPQMVALLCGPLVLFAMTDNQPRITAEQLQAARKIGRDSWRVETETAALTMLPFTSIEDQPYSTYLKIQST